MRNYFLLLYHRSSKGKTDKFGKAPIYLRITVDSIRTEIPTNVRVEHSKWNANKKEVIGKSEEVQAMNASLKSLEAKANSYYYKLLSEGKPITADILRDAIHGRDINRKSIIQLFVFHNQHIKEQIGKGYNKCTVEKYDITLNKIKKFMEFHYPRKDMLLSELKLSFVADFEHYLKTHDNVAHNTAAKYIKNLKHVMNFAITYEWLAKNPFIGFKCAFENTNRERLTETELLKLENKHFDLPRLELIKDMYVFSCYTGLSFIDLYNLSNENIEKGIDGNLWININRTKTGVPSKIPLLPVALDILKKYSTYPTNCLTGKVLPVPSNQKFNSYLKEIADLSGISKNLTVHTARHTFATTVTLENKIPIETVSKMLGHANLKTTQIYAKVTDTKTSRDMAELILKKNNIADSEQNHTTLNKTA